MFQSFGAPKPHFLSALGGLSIFAMTNTCLPQINFGDRDNKLFKVNFLALLPVSFFIFPASIRRFFPGLVVSAFFVFPCLAQKDWNQLRPDIQKALAKRDTARLQQLWKDAKNRRAFDLGRADVEIMYPVPDSGGIDEESVEKAWSQSLDNLMAWELKCPEAATETPLALLGLCYAQRAENQLVPAEKAKDIIQMLLGQQFTGKEDPIASGLQPGSFGLVVAQSLDSCGFSGPLQKNILSTAKKYPAWKRKYVQGPFAGMTFLVADQGPGFEKTEAWMGNHVSWAVAECIAFNRVFPDTAVLGAALLAGNWLEKEMPVTSFHFNARLITGLALLYAETGNHRWRDRLIWLLNGALGPGQLLDEDQNGLVDGTTIPFDSLVPVARQPGRFFDGQNASSWNTAVCANAMLQAHLAFKKRGNAEESSQWKIRTEAALENLCREICRYGIPPAGTGFRELAFVIFEALNFLENPSPALRSQLEKSARIIWNSGVLQNGNLYTVNLGQMMLWLKGRP